MPKSTNTPVIRASTTKERVGDKIRDVYESLGEQPLAKLADLLGLSDFAGIKESFTKPDDGVRMGTMPGSPGKGMLSKLSKSKFVADAGRALTKNQRAANTATEYATEVYRRGGPSGRPFGQGNSPVESSLKRNDFLRSEGNRVQAGQYKAQMRPEGGGPRTLGGDLPAEARASHPSLPPEFQEIMAAPRRPQANTAPIDMNNLPSGRMEYLDPDVADFMNPAPIDAATSEGQRRLQAMLALIGGKR